MKRTLNRLAGCALILASMALSSRAQDVSRAPEDATGKEIKSLVIAKRHMIAAAHPLAAEAGRSMLRDGGSAVDAAIATQLVLGLVEPQSSGLGGGAFLVLWDAAGRTVRTYDGRETAPAAAKGDRFLEAGKPIKFDVAVRSGMSVGVPGLLRVLELAHRNHGKLPWAKLFEPAIRLAELGFPVPERLHLLLRWHGADSFDEQARRYFFDDQGAAREANSLLRNPEYAATLKAIAENGADEFYRGRIAEAVVQATGALPAAGDMSIADLAAYAAKERPPLCFSYRARHLCGMAPPSSGTIAVAQTLLLIEPYLAIQGPAAAMAPAALHIIAEAEKLAFADRGRYVGDPDFTTVPNGLLDRTYLAERRKLINSSSAMAKAEPGVPPGASNRIGIDSTVEAAGTSHISAIDAFGNGVAMTTTIESAFGSHRWAAGFLLNNEMTDFSFRPVDANGVAIANRVEPGKRPRSSMSPMLVFDRNGDLEIVTGSPGGSRIILFTVKALVAMLDWERDAATAAALPNFGSEGGAFQIEYGLDAILLGLAMKGYGHKIVPDLMTSGIHSVARRDGQIEGGADPRREGAALGD